MTATEGNETVTSELDHRSEHPARAEIMVVTRAHAPACFPLYPEMDSIVRVGTRSVCDLILEDDQEVSGDHFGIVHCGRSLWRITDYGSKNGTFVNGALVRGGSIEHEAEPHIVVRAGGTILVLGEFSGLLRSVDVGKFVIGNALASAHNLIANYAANGISVVILGETGSGKEEAARVAHRHGRNKRGPFVAENASKLTESLADSQLFGVTKGAATGVGAQRGLFGDADGGTLFLDEIHALPRTVQSKLLRVLQDGTMRMVGGSERRVDVQLVCATNVDLRARVASGDFAEDLYMRIAGAEVELPPLRARPEEIPHLVAAEAGAMPVHADYIEACLLRPWPGNVRELRAQTKAAVVRAMTERAKRLRASDLGPHVGMPSRSSTAPLSAAGLRLPAHEERLTAAPRREPRDPRWPALKEHYLAHGNQTRAAEAAGVPLATANRWLREAGLVER